MLGELLALPDEELIAALGGTAPRGHRARARRLRRRAGARTPRGGRDARGLPPRPRLPAAAARRRRRARGAARRGRRRPARGAVGRPTAPAVAIVGARRAGVDGLQVARGLGRGLAAAGVTVISGMALGIDSAAHAGALEVGGPTIAVLAGGADVAYPASKRALHRELVRGQAAISEMPPGFRPFRWCFPARNRTIAGLAPMTIVVEATERSGSLITAELAQRARPRRRRGARSGDRAALRGHQRAAARRRARDPRRAGRARRGARRRRRDGADRSARRGSRAAAARGCCDASRTGATRSPRSPPRRPRRATRSRASPSSSCSGFCAADREDAMRASCCTREPRAGANHAAWAASRRCLSSGRVRARRVPVALSIAGSDSGGGAGIQADLKAFARAGVHGTTAITAITVQNTVAVVAVQPVAPEIIAGQIRAVAEDLGVDAVKIGMLGDVATIEAVAARARRAAVRDADRPRPGHGRRVRRAPARRRDAVDALRRLIVARATVITPNLAEARALAGDDDARRARARARAARARAAQRRRHRRAPRERRPTSSSTARRSPSCPASAIPTARRTARAARTPRRSRRGWRSATRRCEAARHARERRGRRGPRRPARARRGRRPGRRLRALAPGLNAGVTNRSERRPPLCHNRPRCGSCG